jgi:hypothetical protein
MEGKRVLLPSAPGWSRARAVSSFGEFERRRMDGLVVGWLLFAAALGIGILVGWAIWG